jgi:hypothetical protein
MDQEQSKKVESEQPVQHLSHTYQDDMSKAMNATDVTEVHSMLVQAREQEEEAVTAVTERREKSWYGTTSTILILLTLAVIAYGTYYYMTLTVPVQPAVSVGVFSNTDPIAINATTIKEVLATERAATDVPVGKPILLNLVTDTQAATPLSTAQLFSFIGADLSTPLESVMSSARLGIVNTGKDILPFIVASVPDPEKASNEFTVAEPTLYANFSQLFTTSTAPAPVLEGSADNSQQAALSELVASQQTQQTSTPEVTPPTVIPDTFQSQYFYNLPVRTLTSTDQTTGEKKIVFLYGYATNNVMVITSTPEVLKAVYDTLISQH